MKVNIFDFPVGSVRLTGDASMAANLGCIASQDGNVYRLVKANGSIATPAGKTMTAGYNSTGKDWSVNIPTSPQLPCDGVIPNDYGSTTIATGSYFWIQISGIVTTLAGTTTIVYGVNLTSIVYANTSGQVALFTAVSEPATVLAATIGLALNTAVCTAVGDKIKMQITGLI